MLMPEAFRMKAWKKLPYWRFFEKAHLERAGLIHVTSELEAGSVRVRLPHVSIVVIPSGCSLEVPAVEPMFVQGVRHYVLFLGRLHPIKNLEKLIPAAASLPDGWALVVAGEGTPQYEERLRAAAARLAHGKVRFLGWLDAQEKFRALRGAAALVLPSLSENFGNVVLEALAVGTPVIASTGTPWSLLEPEGAGLWVPPETNALAAAMAQVWGDEAAWSGKRRNAARLAERFSWPSLAKQMVAAYETLDHRRETSSP
jgi:glycosyltransferase involved in cell wall biosynthesis